MLSMSMSMSMNEENNAAVSEMAEPAENAPTRLSTPEKGESTTEPAPVEEATPVATTPVATPPVATPPVAAEASPDDEKKALEAELSALREELRRKKEEKELLSLFPGLEEAPLPEEVTAMAEGGVPLAAAYALYHCRMERRSRLAAEEQAKNHGRSSGYLGSGDGGAAEGGFTLAEISRMSPKEVRKHYREILRSLEKGK